MANQETAYGLRPIGLVGASANSTGITQYEIASDNTNAIFQYGLVIPLAAGVIDQAGDTAGGTTAALGVLMGVEYMDSVSKKPVFSNYWPGSNSVSVDTNFPVKALVADNPCKLSKSLRTLQRPTGLRLWRAFLRTQVLGRLLERVAQIPDAQIQRCQCHQSPQRLLLPLKIMGIVDDDANSDFVAAGIPLIVRINAHYNSPNARFDSQTTATTTGI